MKNLFVVLLICLSSSIAMAQSVNWPDFLSKQDLIWENNLDTNFFHGAFIGDGIQGAMIMKDSKNPNGIRMLLSHYKAISHYTIPNWEYTDSKVYAGNMIIAPVGKTSTQTMRMNLYDGETSGIINTDKGSINWRAFADRKNNVFIVVLKGDNEEVDAKLGVREEWGITPRIYLDKKNVAEYASYLPPKPELTKQGEIDLIINKMKTRGAHTLASQLIKEADGTQILYVAIGTSDKTPISTAATEATSDAVNRIQSAVAEGYVAITTRHLAWWHNYMESSYLEIKQDPYWNKFWYIQLYKFACASAENSDLIMDTQGAWIWESAWAGVWWNLNVQLSYFPMYSANKLDAGRALLNGVDRIYKSGALRENAGGIGITLGRSSTYDGKSNWGEEFGNLPWILQCYHKYWKYSGNDTIGRALFPMLKDNAVFLSSKLKKEADGKYHLAPSRSPEYEDNGGEALNKDTNYGLMSAKWVFQTLLEMNEELGLNDPQKAVWQEKLDNMTSLPIDDNGFKVNGLQGFDMGHRHFSHLIGIYPYHIINPDQGKAEKELIEKSLERWQTLTQANGYAGYTFTVGSAMYATVGNGNKALATLDLMKTHKLIQLNTMYYESGGQVIETPLSGVESIDYMLLQSWNDVIRIFPAVPARWKDIAINNFRTEGAFLISAKYNEGLISEVNLFSEMGKTCTMENPWKNKFLIVKDENGTMLNVTKKDEYFVFPTIAGHNYTIEAASIPEILSGKVEGNPTLIQLKLSQPIIDMPSFSGIVIIKNEVDTLAIQQIALNAADTVLEVIPENEILFSDELAFNYSNGNLISPDSIKLLDCINQPIDNLLIGSSPRLVEAKTDSSGAKVSLVFNKKMKSPLVSAFRLKNSETGQTYEISSLLFNSDDSCIYTIVPSVKLYLEDKLTISIDGSDIQSADDGILKAIPSFSIENVSPGIAPAITKGIIINKAKGLQLTFTKNLLNVKSLRLFFSVTINGKPVNINSVSNIFNVVSIALPDQLVYGDVIKVSFSGSELISTDRGVLTSITNYEVENTIPEVVLANFVSQSSTAYSGLAVLAADGNTNGNFNQGSVSHTNENTSNPWWMWNRNKQDTITQINIWNRTDCCGERLSNFYVFVSKTPFTSDNPTIVSADPAVWKYFYTGKAAVKTSIKVNTIGQYIRIQIPGTATLSLAEVEVITGPLTTGIKELNQFENIDIYPNPINGQEFSVNFTTDINFKKYDFKLFDIYGRNIPLEVKSNGSSFDFSLENQLQSGIYLFSGNIDGKTLIRKLIVN